MRKRKRCPFCRCLFAPDPRVRGRQWACTKAECQGQRRKASQQAWRQKHPEDRPARKLRAAMAQAKQDGQAPLPPPPPTAVPWDEMRDEISPQLLVILGFLARLGAASVRDEIRAQVLKITAESGRLRASARGDETAVAAGPG